jgi:hypothetical protein
MYWKLFSRPVLVLVILFASLVFVLDGSVHAQSSTIDQCANGDDNSDPTCTSSGDTGWINGNVNETKATYAIGDFVAYRQTFADLTVGYTYCFGFGWDTNINGKPAIDYIGTFNNTLTQADPTHGYTEFSVNSPAQIFPIPPDPALNATMDGQSFTGSQPLGVITTWGTTLFLITSYSNNGLADLDSNATFQQSIEYCFVAADDDAIIAWSGHIADPAEWGGLPRPSGSAYHTSQGTRQGLVTFPRESETDLVCIPNDGGEIQHNNEGREEVQLQILRPTAVSLTEFSTSGGQGAGDLTAFLIIASVAGASYVVLKQRKG